MTEPVCAKPEACERKGRGRVCRRCNARAQMSARWTEPGFREHHAERLRELHRDPEFAAWLKGEARERMARLRARGIVGGRTIACGFVGQELDDYRTLRRKRFSPEEAAEIIARSRRA